LCNFFHSPVWLLPLGAPKNIIFKLSGLKFDLTIVHSMPCGKVQFIFPTFFLISVFAA
jgi:hypothetical protein